VLSRRPPGVGGHRVASCTSRGLTPHCLSAYLQFIELVAILLWAFYWIHQLWPFEKFQNLQILNSAQIVYKKSIDRSHTEHVEKCRGTRNSTYYSTCCLYTVSFWSASDMRCLNCFDGTMEVGTAQVLENTTDFGIWKSRMILALKFRRSWMKGIPFA